MPTHLSTYRLFMQTDAPDPSRVPPGELLGVTIVLLTCSYQGKEFVRIGYYVNSDYADQEMYVTDSCCKMLTSTYDAGEKTRPRLLT